MKVRVDHLKLSASTQFGAFSNRTFNSVEAARNWILTNIPEADRDLVRIRIDGRAITGSTLQSILTLAQ